MATIGRVSVACAAVLLLSAPAAAQDTLYAPSVWDLNLGAHASELPADAYIDFACGTDGGPPSVFVSGWVDYPQCAPEPASGFHEIYFQYDDEPEYWALAHSLDSQIALHQYTSAYGIPIIVSGLFDEHGFLTGIRMVTDSRAPFLLRAKGANLAWFLTGRYGDEGWTCVDLPRREGESEYVGAYINRRCEKADVQLGLNLSLEIHHFRKPGQHIVDPATRLPTRGKFESTVRFEAVLADGIANPLERLAALRPSGPSEKELLVERVRECPGCDLRGVNLKRADLAGANLAGANLAGANLHGAILAGANLEGADLTRANINRANVKRANLRDANLRGAMIFETRLDGADLTRADLTEALAGKVQLIRANLSDATMIGMDLRHARLNDANFSGADLTGSWIQDSQLTRADLTDATLRYTLLWRVRMLGATLSGANLQAADLYGADLRDANLTAADFSYARLAAARLSGATIAGVRWVETELPVGFRVN